MGKATSLLRCAWAILDLSAATTLDFSRLLDAMLVLSVDVFVVFVSALVRLVGCGVFLHLSCLRHLDWELANLILPVVSNI